MAFIDEGDVEMCVLAILHRNHFDGLVIPDHSPRHAGTAHTIGFMLAVEAVFESPHEYRTELELATRGNE